ncbi:hypothetical protein SARC_04215 [Sphaeroforma arctica JP610]|uniref:SGNH hydrolase-type esterase domain-containing protein n=1 Tax=Sphaeroforma arctica JP610 TaxID=667725 RepID=A0A0L0G335_9EUKA|nr:hypothetical protein SARC_04215 [Sphaeroforma arctica JP610]KNC83542.1 hypothetical protein SARC_04215 [Sphaeroforma arctica JP610]|eukprot:XP_014157444.1 hypothetical protein SARC_04215 [Sphaeroforma arctica JP610]
MSTGDTRDLDSREVTVASLWVGTNDVYWSLHQNPMEAVDFVAIADRTVRLVEDVLEKGFDTVLVGRIIDPAYMPGFQYFRLSADQFRALEAGYSEYVVQLEAGLERVRKRREQRPQNEVLYWNPQLIMEQHLSRTPADELGPDQHPQEAAEMNTIICTRAECLFVADGFHPKSSTQSLFGRHVSMMLQKHMMSCDKA